MVWRGETEKGADIGPFFLRLLLRANEGSFGRLKKVRLKVKSDPTVLLVGQLLGVASGFSHGVETLMTLLLLLRWRGSGGDRGL